MQLLDRTAAWFEDLSFKMKVGAIIVYVLVWASIYFIA